MKRNNKMQFQPWTPFNISHHTPFTAMSHNVIGEGDVVAIVSAGGVVQYFFSPAIHSVTLPQDIVYNQNFNNVSWNSNKPLWFVRSMHNRYQTPTYSYPVEGMVFNPFDAVNNQPVQTYELKFHNDCWTSTTDLHYFYPSLRQYNWFPCLITKGSAAVQVEMPNLTNNVCHYEIACNCVKKNKLNCNCHDTTSVMSIDEITPKRKTKCETKKSNSSIAFKNDVCKCRKCDTLAKSLNKSADRACGLSIAAESQTQTTLKKKNMKAKKTKRSKGKQQKELETDETFSDSGQTCNCYSETE